MCTLYNAFSQCAGEGHDASPMYGDASGNLAASSSGPGLPTLLGNPTSGEQFYPYHNTIQILTSVDLSSKSSSNKSYTPSRDRYYPLDLTRGKHFTLMLLFSLAMMHEFKYPPATVQ